MSDNIYVLSASYNSGDGGGSMYLGESYITAAGDIADTIADLSDCLVFDTESDAWEYRETRPSTGWQITPLPRKRIFKHRLKG